MVVADATVISEDDTTKLLGERWRPLGGISAGGLRVPTEGTLSDLANKHTAFLHRLSDEGFTAVPPLSAYQVVGYRRDADPPTRPFAAFQLLTPDAEGFRVFDPRRAIVVARMVRSATALAAGAAGRSKAWIRTTVLGHGGGPQGQAQIGPDDDRFAYLPLPTIEPRRQNGGRQRVVGSIRRILIAERPGGSGEQVAWARRMLSGYELVNQQTNTSEAVLSLIPSQDSVVRHYVESATTWSTVTPVILPGYDGSDPEKIRRRVSGAKTDEERQQRLDKVTAKTDRLLRKAIEQAGLPPTLAEHAELEWRPVGFLPGVDLASRYALPPYLKSSPRYHVRIRWRDASGQPVSVRGPLVIGAGRYRGLGLFVADEPRRGFV